MNRHVFAPLPARPPACAPMGYQGKNFGLQPPRQTQRSYFDSAFHRTAQKSSTSAIKRRSSCLHVDIAWRIYYHKLKKMHQKSHSLPRETVMKFPITNLLDSERPKEPRPSCRRPYLDSAFGSTAGREKAINAGHNTSDAPEPHPSSTPAFHPNEKADLERPKSCQTNPTSGSLDRKRHLEGHSSGGVKRPTREPEGEWPDPSLFTAPCTDPSTRRMQAQPASISRLYASCRCRWVSFPSAELRPYQTASWEKQRWSHRVDVHLRQKVFKEYFCERFPPTLAPRVYSSLDSVYLPDQNTLPSFLSLL